MPNVADWLNRTIYEIERVGSWDKTQVGLHLSKLFSMCLGLRPYKLGDFQELVAYLAGISPDQVEHDQVAYALESHIASAAMQVSVKPKNPQDRGWVKKLLDLISGQTKVKEEKFQAAIKSRRESFGFLCRQIGIDDPKIEAGELADFLQEVLSHLPSQPVDQSGV